MKSKITFTMAFIAVIIFSCRKEISQPAGSIDAVIKQGGVMEDFENKTTIGNTTMAATPTDTGTWLCTTNTYNVLSGTMEYPIFDPNTSVIYPGNLLQGSSLYKGTPDVIPVKRGPGTFSIDLANGSWNVVASVTEVTKSKVSTAVNTIINNNNGTLASNFLFSSHEVETKDQLSIQVGANLNYPPFINVSGTFNFASGDNYKHFIVKMTQIFYTISYDIPTSASQFFDPAVTPANLAQYVYQGNPATYISDVTYGRVFYMLIESTSSSTAIDAAINLSFQIGPFTSSGGNAAINYLSELDSLKIKVLALGGEAGTTISTIGTTNLNQLVYMLSQSSDIETGVPLSYVVRNMYGHKVVKNKVAVEYDITDCSILDTDTLLGNPVLWLDAANITPDIDGSISLSGNQYTLSVANGSVVSHWPDLINPVSAIAYGSDRPVYVPNAINGLPVVEFCHIDDGNNISEETKMSYPGQRFTNTDYTLFAVVAYPSTIDVVNNSQSIYTGPVTPAMFMKGNSQTTCGNLQAGFTENNNFTFDEYNYAVNAGISMSPNFRVYVMQYNSQKGMFVWVNNTVQAQDLTKKNPLLSNIGAALGAFIKPTISPSAYSRIKLAELQGFDKALTNAQINAVVNALKTKYNI